MWHKQATPDQKVNGVGTNNWGLCTDLVRITAITFYSQVTSYLLLWNWYKNVNDDLSPCAAMHIGEVIGFDKYSSIKMKLMKWLRFTVMVLWVTNKWTRCLQHVQHVVNFTALIFPQLLAKNIIISLLLFLMLLPLQYLLSAAHWHLTLVLWQLWKCWIENLCSSAQSA